MRVQKANLEKRERKHLNAETQRLRRGCRGEKKRERDIKPASLLSIFSSANSAQPLR
jgi:hypothetical protein